MGWERDARSWLIPMSQGLVVSGAGMGWSQLCHSCQHVELGTGARSVGAFRILLPVCEEDEKVLVTFTVCPSCTAG